MLGVGRGRLANFLNSVTVGLCSLALVDVSCFSSSLSPPKNQRIGGFLSLSFSGVLVEFLTLPSSVKLDSVVIFLSISSMLGDFVVEKLLNVVSTGSSRASGASAYRKISLTLGILLTGGSLSGDMTGLRVTTGGLLVVSTVEVVDTVVWSVVVLVGIDVTSAFFVVVKTADGASVEVDSLLMAGSFGLSVVVLRGLFVTAIRSLPKPVGLSVSTGALVVVEVVVVVVSVDCLVVGVLPVVVVVFDLLSHGGRILRRVEGLLLVVVVVVVVVGGIVVVDADVVVDFSVVVTLRMAFTGGGK